MMDSNLKPWLLEINTNLSLSSSSPLDRMMKTSLVSDMFNLIGLKLKPKVSKMGKIEKSKIKNNRKSKTEKNMKSVEPRSAIFGIKEEKTKRKIDAKIPRKRKEDLILKTIEEDYRKGDFEKLFPLSTNVDKYKRYFAGLSTLNDKVLWKWLKDPTSVPLDHIKVQHQTAV